MRRYLIEEHRSLSDASLGKIISTGLVLGIVHVLTGPDHLSALAAMTTGSSWRAFALGMRWGCGHSIGLVCMALIFFAAGQTVDLDAVGGYLNYVVGFFMITLGVWTAVHVWKKYQAKVKDGGDQSFMSARSGGLDHNRVSLLRVGLSNAVLPQGSMSPAREQGPDDPLASPSSSYHVPVQETGDSCLATHLQTPSPDKAAGTKSCRCAPRHWTCCRKINFENPTTQKVMALLVGIIHGFAGPGGILGVLPAVVLHDWIKSAAYLGSFCAASIVMMGIFAALYGEVTGRLGGTSSVVEVRIGLFSALFSFLVGVAWVALQGTGQMRLVFGE
ncbi:hypothetical protein PsorP6_015679 [Peronosclerospora sorghi]|uniref:Uncharacterized protein n=1 Tax=Peronosclerospora sorghi TaxID=230839 RepID=A0ACC0WQW6_9STRA|nr:hypothetical protein PsorP6_015679 [Peronosclerospora sorghi]